MATQKKKQVRESKANVANPSSDSVFGNAQAKLDVLVHETTHSATILPHSTSLA